MVDQYNQLVSVFSCNTGFWLRVYSGNTCVNYVMCFELIWQKRKSSILRRVRSECSVSIHTSGVPTFNQIATNPDFGPISATVPRREVHSERSHLQCNCHLYPLSISCIVLLYMPLRVECFKNKVDFNTERRSLCSLEWENKLWRAMLRERSVGCKGKSGRRPWGRNTSPAGDSKVETNLEFYSNRISNRNVEYESNIGSNKNI